jgi:hypothetical protein
MAEEGRRVALGQTLSRIMVRPPESLADLRIVGLDASRATDRRVRFLNEASKHLLGRAFPFMRSAGRPKQNNVVKLPSQTQVASNRADSMRHTEELFVSLKRLIDSAPDAMHVSRDLLTLAEKLAARLDGQE